MLRPLIRPFGFGYQRPVNIRNESDAHYLNVERGVVRSVGGTPNMRLDGPDGRTNGIIKRPIEVKYANKDFRFRVGKRDHEQMLREDGIYIFRLENGQQRQMSARDADRLLAYGWLSDQRPGGNNYEHSFIFVKDVFG